jgi:hypothetical protein
MAVAGMQLGLQVMILGAACLNISSRLPVHTFQLANFCGIFEELKSFEHQLERL